MVSLGASWKSEGLIVRGSRVIPVEDGALVGHAYETRRRHGIDMSLEPDRVEQLRKSCMRRPSGKPDFPVLLAVRQGVLGRDLSQLTGRRKANAGASGRGQSPLPRHRVVRSGSLAGRASAELVEETYHPQPVRQVMIPKSAVASALSAFRRFGTEWCRLRSCVPRADLRGRLRGQRLCLPASA